MLEGDDALRVINETSYPSGEVSRLVRWTLSTFEADCVDVTVSYSRKRDGITRGFYRDWWYPAKGETQPQIRVSLPRPEDAVAPYEPYRRKRERGKVIDLADWREALVAIVAHEATHHRQADRDVAYREVDADLAAFRAVGYYREKAGNATMIVQG